MGGDVGRSCFGGLIRSLPDSLPRSRGPLQACLEVLSSGPTPLRRRLLEGTPRRHAHVAEEYAFVIGVDTHAATHSLALVTAVTGGVIAGAVFPNSRAGLDRALSWITGQVGGQSALVVIEGVGSYGAGFADRVANAGLLVAEPSVMPAAERRGVGKTDALDAVRIARSVAVDTSRLRWPRATGQRVVLRVLTVAREEMVAERTRAINALTALLRTVDLGIDARKALSHSQFKVIASWCDRREDAVAATCRQEAVRLAKRIVALDGELADNMPETLGSRHLGRGDCPMVALLVLDRWKVPDRRVQPGRVYQCTQEAVSRCSSARPVKAGRLSTAPTYTVPQRIPSTRYPRRPLRCRSTRRCWRHGAPR